jgi:hypothetical protein
MLEKYRVHLYCALAVFVTVLVLSQSYKTLYNTPTVRHIPLLILTGGEPGLLGDCAGSGGQGNCTTSASLFTNQSLPGNGFIQRDCAGSGGQGNCTTSASLFTKQSSPGSGFLQGDCAGSGGQGNCAI